jgi:RND superfamily putative drug exporter
MKLSFTGRIARASARRPWLTISAWVVAIAAAFVAAGGLGDVVTQDERMLVPTESDRASELTDQERGVAAFATEIVIIRADEATFGDAEFSSIVAEVEAALSRIDGVTGVTTPSAGDSFAVSAAGDTALVTANINSDHVEIIGEELLTAVAEVESDGFTLLPFGDATGEVVFDGLAEDTLLRGELIGISVAIVILIVVFGALAASGIPLLASIVSIITAVGATAIVGRAFELSFFVLNMVIMMGLALGIDYTLVMVQRFREELAKGRSVTESVAITGNTASRAVFFSGITVLISLVGMLIVPSTIMRSLGAGAMIVAVTAVLAALTLLPAVLQLLGHRVNKGRIPTTQPGAEPKVWTALARRVISRPAVATVAGVAVLVTLALPMLSMRLTFPGLDSLPEDNGFRISADILVEDFGYGRSGTMIAIENASGSRAQVEQLAAAVEAQDAFAETEIVWHGDIAIIDTRDVYDSADVRAEDAIKDLRSELIPDILDGTDAIASVGGEQAESIDFTDMILDRVPLVLAIILGASFLLLLLSFRSVVIPLVSIALNVLSAAASFGLLVAVFQYGWGADLLGLPQVDGIAPWIPLFLFAVLFGLSMDYHVFLLSRIKERYDSHGDTREAVVFGLSRTGSLITGAALIMVAVFSGFALGDLAEFAQMGFGLAAAVIIDATIVRTLLVPAIMAWLGRANWYLPAWLEWLPHMSIETPAESDAEVPARPEREPVLV